jgi:NAD(P)-dependent dehydrogenase (short-subunit alcohol dehydrogenase family)
VPEFEQVKAVADRAVEEYGRLDTWVHLAAVLLVASFENTTPEEFARLIDVNLMGQVYGAMAALPHIKREGGGALIHVSSMGAKRSIPLQSAYCASKHGIDGFLEALRVELKHEGWPISVTQMMPGTINTPFFDKAHQAGPQAGRSATDLPAGHRLRSHPPCRREPGSGSGRRGRGQGGNPQPGSRRGWWTFYSG